MVGADQPCADVLLQTDAARRAIEQRDLTLVACDPHHSLIEGAERPADGVLAVYDLAFH